MVSKMYEDGQEQSSHRALRRCRVGRTTACSQVVEDSEREWEQGEQEWHHTPSCASPARGRTSTARGTKIRPYLSSPPTSNSVPSCGVQYPDAVSGPDEPIDEDRLGDARVNGGL